MVAFFQSYIFRHFSRIDKTGSFFGHKVANIKSKCKHKASSSITVDSHFSNYYVTTVLWRHHYCGAEVWPPSTLFLILVLFYYNPSRNPSFFFKKRCNHHQCRRLLACRQVKTVKNWFSLGTISSRMGSKDQQVLSIVFSSKNCQIRVARSINLEEFLSMAGLYRIQSVKR